MLNAMWSRRSVVKYASVLPASLLAISKKTLAAESSSLDDPSEGTTMLYVLSDLPQEIQVDPIQDEKVSLDEDPIVTEPHKPLNLIELTSQNLSGMSKRVDDELSYGFWYPPDIVRPNIDLDTFGGEFMLVPETLAGQKFRGMAAIKIAARDKDGGVAVPIPVPNVPNKRIYLNRVAGVSTATHNSSIWSRVVSFFKKAIRFAIRRLFVDWLGTWSDMVRTYNQANRAGLKARLPWHSHRKERVKIYETGGRKSWELKMNKNAGPDYNQRQHLLRYYELDADSKRVLLWYKDSKYSDNDGHVRLQLYFYA